MKVIDDRYGVLECVESRERSDLYRVEDRLRPGRVLMLKMLRADSEEERQSFANDFRVRASLRHRGVARVYELGSDPATGAPYYTGEWIGGRPWDEVAATAEPSLLYRLCADVCSTLEHCHGRGLLHLDLKPDNLLVVAERGELRAKVLDFGLAQGRLRLGAPGGTPIYMAPEVLEGRAYDLRADLYSLGVSLLPQERRPDVPGQITAAAVPDGWPRPLATVVRRLTERDPDDRFGSARAVLRYLERAAALPAPFLRELREEESPFVGRDVAMMRLRDAFRRRFDGAALRDDPDAVAAVVLLGEPGIGKTRLMREFRATVATLPPVVVGGDPYAEDVPCPPLGDPMARLWQRREVRAGPGRPFGRVLEALIPGLRPPPEAGGREPSGQPDLVRAAADYLVEAGKLRPGTLFLDDLDRGDPIGPAVLAELLTRPDNPWFVVATARALDELPRAEMLVLGGLEERAITAMLQARFEEARVDAQLATRVRRVTGGNPAFLEVLLHEVEVVPHGRDATTLALPDLGELKTPADLAEAIRQRQGGLPPEQKTPLGFLALAGRPVVLDNICLALGVDETEMASALDALVERGLVRREGRGGGARYRFAHEHHAAATAEALPAGTRRQYHAAMARLLAHADDVDDLLDLARHLARSDEPERAAGVLLRAAERARARFAHDVAETALRRAAAVVPERAQEVRSQVLLALGALLVQVGRYRAAEDSYREVERLVPDLRDAVLSGRLALHQGELALKTGEKGLGLALIERAARALEDQDTPGELTTAYARLADAYMYEDRELARQYCDRALASVTDASDPNDLAALHRLSGQLAALSGDYAVGLEDIRTAVGQFREAGLPSEEALALNLQAQMHLDLGALDEALSVSQRAVERIEEVGDLDQFGRVATGRGDALLAAGEYAEALTWYRRGLDQAVAIGHQIQEVLARMRIGRLLGRIGAPDEAQAELERAALVGDAIKDRGAAGEARVWLSVVRFRAGDTEGLDMLLDRAERALRPVGLKRALDAAWMVRSALQMRMGLYAEASAALGALLEAEPLPEVACTALRLMSRLERARADGDLPAAYGHAREALAIAERTTNPDARWRCLEEFALVSLAVDERERAAEALQQLQGLADWVDQRLPSGLAASPRIHRAGGRLTRELGEDALPRATASMQLEEPRLQLVAETLRALHEELPAQTHLVRLMELALELTGAERAMIRLDGGRDDDGDGEGPRELFSTAEPFPTSERLLEGVLRTGQVTWTANAAEDPRFAERDSVLAHRLRSVLCAPLRLGDRVEGVLYVDNPFLDAAFGPREMTMLEALASLVALIAQGARLGGENRDLRAEVARMEEMGPPAPAARPEPAVAPGAILPPGSVALQRGQLKHAYEEIVGQHPALVLALQTVDHIVDTEIPVYIHGESGTGKELFARAVHFNGARAERPFLALNCAAVPEQLMESELFGHTRGAFTGATADRKGLFEMADGGTLFLDEVADMSPAMQARLLRVLQEGEVRRVGSARTTYVDVRILAASHRDLVALVETQDFRQDVYFRLCAITVTIPSLRERSEDIPLLLQAFLDDEAQERGAAPPQVDPRVVELLSELEWPGNVRQLRNVVRTAWALGSGRAITCAEVAMALGRPELASGPSTTAAPAAGPAPPAWEAPSPASFARSKEEQDRESILSALRQTGGNKVAAAKMLGISRRTLYRKLERLGIEA